MQKFLLPAVTLLLVAATGLAQSAKSEFEILLPKKAVSQSLYTSIRLLDSREDTTYLGSVQKGLLHTTSNVVFEPALPVQLSAVMQKLVGTKSAGDTIIFQLRHMVFSQKPGYMSNKSYCFIKASLYAAKADKYIPLAALDTLLTVKTLTADAFSIFNTTGKCINSFIAASLNNNGKDAPGYSWNTLLAIDSLEKSGMPVYTTTAYNEGIYGTWEAFKIQQPDWTSQLVAEPKDGKIKDADFIDKADSTRKYLDAKHVYAIVYQGQPYISGEDGYYLMERRNNNLYFIGKARVWADAGEIFLSRQLLGPLSFLHELNQKAIFEMKIDHSTGMFIRTKQVKDTAETK